MFRFPRPVWEEPNDQGAAPKPDAAAAPDASAPPADKAAPASFLSNADDPAISDKPIAAPVDWPEDWRDKLAGGDKDIGKLIERYKSPNEVAKALREANKKIGSGKVAADEPMPDGEKDPEGLKAWRQARGIPDDPTGYTIPDTVKDIVTDADKPLIAAFTETMHTKGIPPAAAAAAMEWYFQQQDTALQATIDNDKAAGEALQEELRSEWGSDFRPNSVLAKRIGQEIFGELPWSEARLPDGRRLGDVPEMIRSLAKAGTSVFGDAAFAGSENAAKTEGRKAEIERIMREDFDRYDSDPALKKELQAINEAEERRNAARR